MDKHPAKRCNAQPPRNDAGRNHPRRGSGVGHDSQSGLIDEIMFGCDLEVDGGIDATTAPLVINAGANVLVAGSAILNEREGVMAAMKRLRAAVG